MGIGYLIVQARTIDGALPLEGVRVSIKNQEGVLLKELTTDISGTTEETSLEAVDRALSLDPGYTGTPYTNYDLIAEAEGFNTIHLSSVHFLKVRLRSNRLRYSQC